MQVKHRLPASIANESAYAISKWRLFRVLPMPAAWVWPETVDPRALTPVTDSRVRVGRSAARLFPGDRAGRGAR